MTNTGVSILIVEDEPNIRSLLTEILSPRFQCSTVENASKAIRMMNTQFFHLALVDVGLPGMSGISLCRLIANRSPRTIVIIISGHTDDQSVADAMMAGAVDYITKPFDLSDVVAKVEHALGRNSPGAAA